MRSSKAMQSSDLPKSFDLRKYEACAEFGASGWYHNLMMRALRRNTAATHREAYLDELKRGADHFLENPMVPASDLQEGDGYSKNVFRSQIRDQTAYELVSGRWILDTYGDRQPSYQEAFATMDREVFGDTKYDEAAEKAYDALDVPAWKMMNDLGVDQSGEVVVNVDLFASEDKLIDDFRIWLRATRAAMNVPSLQRRFARSDFDRWHQNRILAYLDLSFWADIHGYRLTNQILGVALFPDEYNVSLAERIRKVVAPMSLAASSHAYLDALVSQALSEAESK